MNYNKPLFRASPYLLFQLFCIYYLSCYCVHSSSATSLVSQSNIRCSQKEKYALLNFKHGIEFDKCNRLSSWGRKGDSLDDCCEWPGVRCSNRTGHVIRLDLNGREDCPLQGNLSSSLVDLKNLKYLNLGSNDFQQQSIPTFLGSLSKLKHLNLSDSLFAGEIPPHLGNLSRLTFLDLSNNFHLFSNSLSWVSRLSLLQNLRLSNCYLIEATDWFRAINNLPLLKGLHLDYCLLPSTTIYPPFSYTNSSANFAVINLANNFLNDSKLFEWLFNLSEINTHLVHLDFSYNSFSGPIPKTFGKIHTLSYLDLSNNQFQGSIPNEIGNIRSLSYLDLSNNQLTGLIPNAVGNLQSLTNLQLSDNSLSGHIPDAIGNLESLLSLKLSNNLLSGPIPDAMRSLKSIKYLDLSNNSITTTIPHFLGYLPELTYLDLSHNLLTGVIPQLDQVGILNSLDLSFNRLSGPIPSSLWRFQYYVFSGNLHLCGEPLTEDCPLTNEGNDDSSEKNNNEDKTGNDTDKSFYIGLFVSAGIGFYLGFWGVCGTLVFKHSWRYAYFQFVDKIMNKIYVSVAIYVARIQRSSQMQNL